MTQHRHLHIVTTGGTFDKRYPPDKGSYAFVFGTPAAPKITERASVAVAGFTELEAKDSLDMKARDRERIADACGSGPEKAIVVTHGTDTMIETAAVIAKRGFQKVVVLTGAAQPEGMKETDADFNLGCAVGAAKSLPEYGVYIAMNGCVFPWNDCVKLDNGRFVNNS